VYWQKVWSRAVPDGQRYRGTPHKTEAEAVAWCESHHTARIIAAIDTDAIAALVHALVVWDMAFRTGKNEPLVHAFETGQAALARLGGGE
jgi:hypothetical protein